MKSRKAILVAGATAAALVLSACSGGGGQGDKDGGDGDPVKVGVVISLSGPGSAYGIPGEKTLQLLAKEYNKGSATPKVELTIVDDESQAAKAITAARSLLSQGADVIIGASISSVGVPLSEALQADKVPFIATAVDQRITEPKPGEINSHVFQTPESQALNVAAMLTFAKDHGLDKVGMIYDSTALGQGAFAALTEQAEKAGVTIAAGESIDADAGTSVPQLVKVRSAGAQALFVYAGHAPSVVIQKDFVQLGWDVPIVQSSEALTDSFRDSVGADAYGALAPSVRYSVGSLLPDSDPQKKVIADWTALADKELGGAKIEQIYYWDAWAILEAGLKGLKSPDQYDSQEDFRSAFVKQVSEIKNLVGLVGVRTFTPEDHRGLSVDGTMVLVRLTKDGPQLAE